MFHYSRWIKKGPLSITMYIILYFFSLKMHWLPHILAAAITQPPVRAVTDERQLLCSHFCSFSIHTHCFNNRPRLDSRFLGIHFLNRSCSCLINCQSIAVPYWFYSVSIVFTEEKVKVIIWLMMRVMIVRVDTGPRVRVWADQGSWCGGDTPLHISHLTHHTHPLLPPPGSRVIYDRNNNHRFSISSALHTLNIAAWGERAGRVANNTSFQSIMTEAEI